MKTKIILLVFASLALACVAFAKGSRSIGHIRHAKGSHLHAGQEIMNTWKMPKHRLK